MHTPSDLRCEYFVNPMPVDEERPRLFWKLRDERRGARQTAYRVQVAGSESDLAAERGLWWDSGKVESDRATHVEYEGPAVKPGRRAHWRVMVWDHLGAASAWSEPAWWEAGLPARSDWGDARWIGAAIVGGPRASAPAPYLRKSFALDGEVVRARLYATALGLYELHVNGQRVGDACFRPGWTDYTKRVQYQAYDVTALLQRGDNAIGAILGDGWAVGHVAWHDRQFYFDRPRLLARLVVETADGQTHAVVTDDSWRWATGPIIESDFLQGESYDARLEMPGWSAAGFGDAPWAGVVTFEDPGVPIVASAGPPVRRVMELKPVAPPAEVPRSWPRKRWLFDLGQNMVGWVRLKVRGPAGATWKLRYAEMLNADGTIYVENLRSARATDYYTCRGSAEGEDEVWEPRFTFHGFRYVELTGMQAPGDDAVTGIVAHSDTPATGTFECSHPLVNRLQQNIQWGQRGNFLEVPTDCPQRDERLGWTGDAQVFIRTACFNMNVAGFFTKWQQDIADAQAENGAVPCIVPDVELNATMTGRMKRDGGPAWSDATVICPWTIYRCYGDTRLLERHYASLRKYIDYLVGAAHELIRVHPLHEEWCGYGDWLAVDAPAHDVSRAPTPKDLIGTAYLAYDAGLLAEIADAIGNADEAAKLRDLRRRVVEAFNREYVSENGRVLGDTQTAYLLALGFDLLPESKRKKALDHLVKDIECKGKHLSTGFVGTPLLCPVLSRFGRHDVAYRLLLQETYPSWLYTVLQGATTMWERWNSYTKDKGFGDAGMNSFNHYAYGAIGQWMYATVAGIELDPTPGAPGYKRFIFRPTPPPMDKDSKRPMTYAKATLQTLHGAIESGWRIEGDALRVEVAVPPNTTATVELPVDDAAQVSGAEGLELLGASDGRVRYAAPAGRYAFEVALTAAAPV